MSSLALISEWVCEAARLHLAAGRAAAPACLRADCLRQPPGRGGTLCWATTTPSRPPARIPLPSWLIVAKQTIICSESSCLPLHVRRWKTPTSSMSCRRIVIRLRAAPAPSGTGHHRGFHPVRPHSPSGIAPQDFVASWLVVGTGPHPVEPTRSRRTAAPLRRRCWQPVRIALLRSGSFPRRPLTCCVRQWTAECA